MRCLALLLPFLCVAAAQRPELNEFKEVYMWNQFDFKWPDESVRLRALSDARFQPVNCALSGIRAWRDRLYVTVPRLLPGVPATLASLPAAAPPAAYSPLLDPFPSWDMQAVGNCTALQYVQSVEIDAAGRMWVPDSGRVNTQSGNADARCPPKLLVIDVESGRVQRTVQFEPGLLAPDSLLADVVVGDDDVAYVSDASPSDPGIVVVSARDSRAWKVRDRTMRADSTFVQVGQRRTELRHNVFALALSPRPRAGPRRLFYSPLSSYDLFSLPADALAAPGVAVSALVRNHGRMQSPVQAAAADWHGNLYLGYLQQDAVARWDSSQPLAQARLLTQDPERLQWISSLAVDADRNLWVVSNRLQNFMAGTVNQQTPNYRVIRAFVDAKSYLYSDDAWTPQQGSAFTVPGAAATTRSSTSSFVTTTTVPPHADGGASAPAVTVLLYSLLLLPMLVVLA
ncbi:protein yellow-like [Schistocerca serialis cubense]|uniref:protein yellow-like n=1 Tax=Schistocerca serialis cubense TaxID=2023355 RepID=UPI00214F28E1|nr:protein yellow-like [Schistocerca serialis cubense]